MTSPSVPPLDRDAWRDRFARHRPRLLPGRSRLRRAAVALVLGQGAAHEGATIVLMRRVARDGDPWSGHMSLPGGRVAASDPSDAEAARRETREEVGLSLRGPPVGQLSDLLAKVHRGPQPMIVTPWVFVGPTDQALAPGPEAAEALEIPLRFFADPANESTRPWRLGRLELAMPAYRWEGRVVWGLTLAILDEVVRVGYPDHPVVRRRAGSGRLPALVRAFVRARRRGRPSR